MLPGPGSRADVRPTRCVGSDPVDLLVLEERSQSNLKNRDQASHKELLSTRQVPRQTRLLQTSPACERLLWLPDLVASAYRRTITHNDRTLFDKIQDQTHFVAPLWRELGLQAVRSKLLRLEIKRVCALRAAEYRECRLVMSLDHE